MQQITTAQIAQRNGVDQSLVSFSLRNSPRISVETRQLIQEAAHELDYRPNPFVSALMRTRRKRSPQQGMSVVAWVSTWKEADTWMHVPVFKAFFKGVKKRLKEHGLRLETRQAVIDVQKRVAAEIPSMFQGRETARLHKRLLLHGAVHFNEEGLTKYGRLCFVALTPILPNPNQ